MCILHAIACGNCFIKFNVPQSNGEEDFTYFFNYRINVYIHGRLIR